MTRVTAIHLLLLVHDNTSRGIRRTLAQKIPHRAVKLFTMSEPVIQSLFAGILTVATANQNHFHRHHPLLPSIFAKKNPSRARVL